MIFQHSETYQGSGQRIVSKSEMAMAMRTILVGVLMCFLLSTMMISRLQMMVKMRMIGMM